MEDWMNTIHCKCKLHCKACLSNQGFHVNNAKIYQMPEYGICPKGVSLDQLPEPIIIEGKPPCKDCKKTTYIQD